MLKDVKYNQIAQSISLDGSFTTTDWKSDETYNTWVRRIK